MMLLAAVEESISAVQREGASSNVRDSEKPSCCSSSRSFSYILLHHVRDSPSAGAIALHLQPPPASAASNGVGETPIPLSTSSGCLCMQSIAFLSPSLHSRSLVLGYLAVSMPNRSRGPLVPAA